MAAQSDGFYNRFDLTDRLFQESVALTSASLSDDVIGFAFSQRLWGGKSFDELLAAQPELFETPDFSSATGWNLNNNPTTNISGGKALIKCTDGTYSAVYQNKAVLGLAYRIACDVDSVVIGGLKSDLFGSSVSFNSGTGRRFMCGIAVSTGANFARVSSPSNEVLIDNASLKLIPGKHATQATIGFRPKLQAGGGAKFDGVDDRLLSQYLFGGGSNFLCVKMDVPASLASTQIAAGAADTGALRAGHLGVASTGELRVSMGATANYGPDLRGTTAVAGISWDGSTCRVFVGNSLTSEFAQPGTVTAAVPLTLGALNVDGAPAAFFGGVLHSIAVGREFIDLSRFRQIASKL